MHVSENSTIPDHCIKYSLSDSSKKAFKAACDHLHNETHDRCEDLKALLDEIKSEVEHTQFSNDDEKDNATYIVRESCNHIDAYKRHQLRTINQDKAKHDVMELLNEHTVLINDDFAMKFLPQLYRESQGNWFAKKGISWHLSHATTKRAGVLYTQCFIHIIEKCKQESSIVVTMMENVLAQLKAENPVITKVYFRSDNAGCYHSKNTIVSCHEISKRTGIQIERYDFCDPQGGKGPCDRFAATVKNHVRIYMNEGHDVATAKDFKEAIESHNGIPGARVTLVEEDIVDSENDTSEQKWEGISSLSNFQFDEKGATAWQAYSIGEGQFSLWSKLEGKKKIDIIIIIVLSFPVDIPA